MFLTIEGGDGSGKSTLIERLSDRFDVSTREPGGCELAEGIREMLLHTKAPIDAAAETLLYLSARAQHIDEVIQPALDAGKDVLCDRFNDSTIAYQGYGRELGREWVEALCKLACHGLEPTLTFYLDIDPEVGLSRLRGEKDRLEGETFAFHKRIREGYLALAKDYPDRIHVIDATQTPEEVFQEAESRWIQK